MDLSPFGKRFVHNWTMGRILARCPRCAGALFKQGPFVGTPQSRVRPDTAVCIECHADEGEKRPKRTEWACDAAAVSEDAP